MKKLFSSVASLAILANSAFAADLPYRKAPPPPPPPPLPLWSGLYGGLNAGYNFGTNDAIRNTAYGAPVGVPGTPCPPKPPGPPKPQASNVLGGVSDQLAAMGVDGTASARVHTGERYAANDFFQNDGDSHFKFGKFDKLGHKLGEELGEVIGKTDLGHDDWGMGHDHGDKDHGDKDHGHGDHDHDHGDKDHGHGDHDHDHGDKDHGHGDHDHDHGHGDHDHGHGDHDHGHGDHDHGHGDHDHGHGGGDHGGGDHGGGGGGGCSSLANTILFNTAALSQTSTINNTQSGFMGGGQIGYNYQWGQFVLGVETDIQGSGTRGGGFGAGTGLASGTGVQQAAIGGVTVNAGVDYLGTVRGRVGYLVMPTMLVYATGGYTYGGVYANVNTFSNVAWNVGPQGFNQSFFGGGRQNQILSGWNVGGGVEWLFTPNWSVKAEAIYWNLGNLNCQTASWGASPTGGVGSMNIGSTNVNYQGVIARVGVNYHLNWAPIAPVMASY